MSQLRLIEERGVRVLHYTENFSKDKIFGLKQSRLEPKNTKKYPNANATKCCVNVYQKYIEHRPESNGLPLCTAFYLTPYNDPKGKLWHKSIPLSIHSNCPKDFCKACIKTNFIQTLACEELPRIV